MTVTTTYGFGPGLHYSIPGGPDVGLADTLGALDLTSLANGQIAFIGDNLAAPNSIAIGTGDGVSGVTRWEQQGSDGHLDQLANGDIAAVRQLNGNISFAILDPVNSTILTGSLTDSSASNPDVAALKGGGFVITDQLAYAGTDKDIQVAIRDSTGAQTETFSLDTTLADDENASVAGLNNGSFVVAWDRADGASTTGELAIYGADGSVRVAPRAFDQSGVDNKDMSVVALAKGGFAVAYVDSGWNGSDNISVELFKANGNFVNAVDISLGGQSGGGSSVDSEPSLTVLQDGTLAVSWTHKAPSDSLQIEMQLLDPKFGHTLLAAPLLVSDSDNPLSQHQSSVTALGEGRVLVGYTDDAINGDQGRVFNLQIERDGGDGKDRIFGSAAEDTIHGLGANDLLRGGDGNDFIDGGDGKDIINGQGGFDVLTGGAGKDFFQFSAIGDISTGDTITDLERIDHISFAKIDADTTTAGDQHFTIVSAFTGHAGQMTVSYDSGKDTTEVDLDVNGDGSVDGFLTLDGDQSHFKHFVL
jgi:Ca2+-binding RTX toxin-like protein